jgi:hypothetical protein
LPIAIFIYAKEDEERGPLLKPAMGYKKRPLEYQTRDKDHYE